MLATTRRLYMFLGGTFLAGGGLVAAACSTDNGTTTQVPTVGDSGRSDTGGSSSGSTSSGGSSSGDPGEAGIDCGKIPTVKSSAGPFCFGANTDAGADASPNKNCDSAQNQICCSGIAKAGDAGFNPSSCESATEDPPGYEVGTSCDTATQQEWHCMEGDHCPGSGAVCCAIGSDAGTPKPGEDNDFPKGCGVYFQSGRFTDGTRCKDTCAAGDIQLCASDAECKAGKCVPITIAGRFGGYCRL